MFPTTTPRTSRRLATAASNEQFIGSNIYAKTYKTSRYLVAEPIAVEEDSMDYSDMPALKLPSVPRQQYEEDFMVISSDSEEEEKPQQQVAVVANYHGKIIYIDCTHEEFRGQKATNARNMIDLTGEDY